MKLTTLEKKQKFMQALVKKFGEGNVAKREDVVEVWLAGKADYPHLVIITKDLDYRVGRGMYVITTSENPKEVAKAAMEKMTTLEKAKEKSIPKAVRNDALKLAKVLAPKAKKPAKQAPMVTKGKAVAVPAMTEIEEFPVDQDDVNALFGSDDINDILSQI